MIPDFNTRKEISKGHAARLGWLCSLDEDALRDILCLTRDGARAEIEGLDPTGGPLMQEWRDKLHAIIDHIESMLD